MVANRRLLYRDYFGRLDPTADPAGAMEWYVPPPGSVGRRIARRLELDPTSSHLLIGGIGSGKTTELLAIKAALEETGEFYVGLVDAPQRYQLEAPKPGMLAAIAARAALDAIGEEVPKDAAKHVASLDGLLSGRWVADSRYHEPDHDDEPDEHRYEEWQAGVLSERVPADLTTVLHTRMRHVSTRLPRRLVVLVDGLDRATSNAWFRAMVTEDVPAMRAAGVGMVIVGRQTLRFGPEADVQHLFTAFHLHGAVSPGTGEGQAFLGAVLRRRVEATVLPDATCVALARWSGGVLRDVIALAREAGQHAYDRGSDVIEETDADAAADVFGRALVLGLTVEMTKRLKELVPTHRSVRGGPPRPGPVEIPFTLSSPADIALLTDRLIIEVPGTPVRYVPHPTIVPLVTGLPG